MSDATKLGLVVFGFMAFVGIAGLLGVLVSWLTRPKAPAYLIGFMDNPTTGKPFALYNLTEPISGHPAGSTVTARTLKAKGFRLP